MESPTRDGMGGGAAAVPPVATGLLVQIDSEVDEAPARDFAPAMSLMASPEQDWDLLQAEAAVLAVDLQAGRDQKGILDATCDWEALKAEARRLAGSLKTGSGVQRKPPVRVDKLPSLERFSPATQCGSPLLTDGAAAGGKELAEDLLVSSSPDSPVRRPPRMGQVPACSECGCCSSVRKSDLEETGDTAKHAIDKENLGRVNNTEKQQVQPTSELGGRGLLPLRTRNAAQRPSRFPKARQSLGMVSGDNGVASKMVNRPPQSKAEPSSRVAKSAMTANTPRSITTSTRTSAVPKPSVSSAVQGPSRDATKQTSNARRSLLATPKVLNLRPLNAAPMTAANPRATTAQQPLQPKLTTPSRASTALTMTQPMKGRRSLIATPTRGALRPTTNVAPPSPGPPRRPTQHIATPKAPTRAPFATPRRADNTPAIKSHALPQSASRSGRPTPALASLTRRTSLARNTPLVPKVSTPSSAAAGNPTCVPASMLSTPAAVKPVFAHASASKRRVSGIPSPVVKRK